ncbi:SDR family NAD(P)-dependent oxidoreductase [Actinomycetospora lutea]|uniref:SDR family NAD(P)-dependent oxidoreductase n=1 Tax=Actinomycetospora lutea TaxID=663604 RepID=UPI0023667FE4|nr:SDR family NAD(P)-dependent oxidoreductase [Actinomycetospora lutea]MDD7939813.1 SDR family NAD(P)-dependent oxidoreductase [Actinomycetospora lutea]
MGERLHGQVVVVTGASRGIGRAIAVGMAAEGAGLALTARDEDTLADTLADIERLAPGTDVLTASCDVTDEASVQRLGDAVDTRFGRVDTVIANAGIAGPTRRLHEISLAEWRECLATDLDGVFLTFRRFIPRLVEQRSGSLVAISSMTGKRPLPGRTPYAAAKTGLIGLVRTLATELGPFGVRANAVCPGAVDGPRIEAVIRDQARQRDISVDAARAAFTDPSPLGRLVRAEEVADACVFLAAPQSSSITGEDLNVSAGVVMY